MKEENLIFIASQPRSGSTFLQNILSSNPQTNTVSEPWIMLGLAPLIKPSLVKAKYDHSLAMNAILDYESKVDLNFIREIKKLALTMYEPLFKDFEFVIDKTPRYWEILGELVEIFPKSKVIIVKRDPIAVAKSMIQTWDIKNLEGLNYFRRDLLIAPNRMHEFCLKHKDNSNVMIVKYEKMLKFLPESTRELYEWAGLIYNGELLNTDSNVKYKGTFGDPYQNNKTKKIKELSKPFQEFLIGYSYFLGEDFLKEYGSYGIQECKKTTAFQFFLDLEEEKAKSNTGKIQRLFSLRLRKAIYHY